MIIGAQPSFTHMSKRDSLSRFTPLVYNVSTYRISEKINRQLTLGKTKLRVNLINEINKLIKLLNIILSCVISRLFALLRSFSFTDRWKLYIYCVRATNLSRISTCQ